MKKVLGVAAAVVVLAGCTSVPVGAGRPFGERFGVSSANALPPAGPIPALESYGTFFAGRPRNVLMVNPLALLGGELDVTYEYVVSDEGSWGVLVGWTSTSFGAEDVTALAVIPLWKGYPGKTAPEGGFYALGLGFMSASFETYGDISTVAFLAYGGKKWLNGSFAFEVGGGLIRVAYKGDSAVGLFLEIGLGFAY